MAIESVLTDTTWRVLWDPHVEEPPFNLPGNLFDELEKLGIHARAHVKPYHGPLSDDTTDPLTQYSRFNIEFYEGEPKITFTLYGDEFAEVWANPVRIFYDREFNAIRGSLRFDRKTKQYSGDTPFIIWYRGIDGEGRKHLGIRFLHHIQDQAPTSLLISTFDHSHELAHSEPHIMTKHKGSWHADDSGFGI